MNQIDTRLTVNGEVYTVGEFVRTFHLKLMEVIAFLEISGKYVIQNKRDRWIAELTW